MKYDVDLSVVDIAIGAGMNFCPLTRFSKNFLCEQLNRGLRRQNRGCLFVTCSESLPPMIIAPSRGWDDIPSM
jgi:hypothetical protein